MIFIDVERMLYHNNITLIMCLLSKFFLIGKLNMENAYYISSFQTTILYKCCFKEWFIQLCATVYYYLYEL